MTVTELAILKAVTPGVAQSPTVHSFLRKVSEQQASCSGFPLLWFRPVADAPDTVYLISGWESVAAHDVWIASAPNKALLKEMEGVFGIAGFYHLDINFNTLPRDKADFVAWEVCDQGQTLAYDSGGGDSAGTFEREAVLWEGVGRVLDSSTEQMHRIRVLKGDVEGTGVSGTGEGEREKVSGGGRVVLLKRLKL